MESRHEVAAFADIPYLLFHVDICAVARILDFSAVPENCFATGDPDLVPACGHRHVYLRRHAGEGRRA